MLDTNIIDAFRATINVDSLQMASDSLQAILDSVHRAKELTAANENKDLFTEFIEWIKFFKERHGAAALLYGAGSVALGLGLWFYNKGRKSTLNQNEKLYNSMININNTMNNRMGSFSNEIKSIVNAIDNNHGILVNKIDAVDNRVSSVKNEIQKIRDDILRKNAKKKAAAAKQANPENSGK